MDDRKKNGGARIGAGRKPKGDEIKLIEKLKPHEDAIIDMLVKMAKSGDMAAIKLYMEYLQGKPKQQMDITSGGKTIALPSWINEGEQ